ncbi:unnamed protein product [Allacma fusca]|uniref:Uncharacterized protein n=1 Tax=Allacma fusca TaxID=39272 RepID=A0A8J2J583_9HEXA|nr:unnamed protein product [Allacma fusca]
MLKIVMISCFLGAVLGKPQAGIQRAADHPHFATVYRSTNENDGNGAFRYNYETSNAITADASGFIKNPEAPEYEQIQYVSGSYSFYTPDGDFHEVTYTADENGYRPVKTWIARFISDGRIALIPVQGNDKSSCSPPKIVRPFLKHLFPWN